jgi:hypothetical protein
MMSRQSWILGGKLTTVEFTIIGDHEHDLPLIDVIIYKSTAYPMVVFARLHLLKLPAQQRCRRRGGSHDKDEDAVEL